MNILQRADRATDPSHAADYGLNDLRTLVSELSTELRELAKEAKEYAEGSATTLDAEFESGDSLEQLIAADQMPEVWQMACRILKA